MLIRGIAQNLTAYGLDILTTLPPGGGTTTLHMVHIWSDEVMLCAKQNNLTVAENAVWEVINYSGCTCSRTGLLNNPLIEMLGS